MPIRVLPDYIINKLKAGEIVERPASIVKELIENSLDANAMQIHVSIMDGGKARIQIEDDGTGIPGSEVGLAITRYATSKLDDENDLYSMSTYGFRGEALASIAEVSELSMITKTTGDLVATKLSNKGVASGQAPSLVPQPVAGLHGTTVIVENLFYNTPVRQKFLKSSQTEYFYCYDIFLGYALMHWDKQWKLSKDEKIIFDLAACDDFLQRFTQIFKEERTDHLRILDFDNDALRMYGVFSDVGLTFGSPEHIKIYVNHRPVQDRVLKKAIMQAYERQITPGLYPLAFLFVDIAGDAVDVNVHPRKMEVRFADPNSLYQCVLQTVRQTLGDQKVMQVDSAQLSKLASSSFTHPGGTTDAHADFYASSSENNGGGYAGHAGIGTTAGRQRTGSFSAGSQGAAGAFGAGGYDILGQEMQQGSTNYSMPVSDRIPFAHHPHVALDSGMATEDLRVQAFTEGSNIPVQWRILGQLWDMYILLEDNDFFYVVDQHALAERIAYERLKVAQQADTALHTLLQPVAITTSPGFLISDYEAALTSVGFDVAALSDTSLVIYAVPTFFAQYKDDLTHVVHLIMTIDNAAGGVTYEKIADTLYAQKACKASIKAGQRLHPQEMQSLITDGLETIPGMFVCQHGRPFMWRFDKGDIDGLFHR